MARDKSPNQLFRGCVVLMTDEEVDRDCIERCLHGEVDAFGTLIDRYQRPVFNVILRMVGRHEDAQELAQQVFMKVFEHLGRFDENRRFFSWIYRMAINESINHLKARRPMEPLGADLAEPFSDPAEELARKETSVLVQQAVQSLDEPYRVVVVLRHFLQLSYHDTAEILNLPEKTVKSRLFTARQLLRARLQGETRP
jgi:RNA polymerase sigma-70 factor (ECF subfamily)